MSNNSSRLLASIAIVATAGVIGQFFVISSQSQRLDRLEAGRKAVFDAGHSGDRSLHGSEQAGPIDVEPDEPRFQPISVPGIDPPDELLAEASKQVEDVLAQLATAQQRYRDATGEWALDVFELIEDTQLPPSVQIRSIVTQPTAFCIEAVHLEVVGAARRFTSVTGQIDRGTCNPERPLAEQIGSDPAAQYGGRWVIQDFRLAEKDISHRYPDLVYKLTFVFDARWQGRGEPLPQACSYTFFRGKNKFVDSGQWNFSTREYVLDDYRGPSFFKTDFEVKPTRAEFTCKNAY